MSQNTVTAKVYAARKFKSKAGNDSFRQSVEILQSDVPSHQIERFANDEKYVLEPGTYTATAKYFNRTYRLQDGKTVYLTEAVFSDYKKTA